MPDANELAIRHGLLARIDALKPNTDEQTRFAEYLHDAVPDDDEELDPEFLSDLRDNLDPILFCSAQAMSYRKLYNVLREVLRYLLQKPDIAGRGSDLTSQLIPILYVDPETAAAAQTQFEQAQAYRRASGITYDGRAIGTGPAPPGGDALAPPAANVVTHNGLSTEAALTKTMQTRWSHRERYSGSIDDQVTIPRIRAKFLDSMKALSAPRAAQVNCMQYILRDKAEDFFWETISPTATEVGYGFGLLEAKFLSPTRQSQVSTILDAMRLHNIQEDKEWSKMKALTHAVYEVDRLSA